MYITFTHHVELSYRYIRNVTADFPSLRNITTNIAGSVAHYISSL